VARYVGNGSPSSPKGFRVPHATTRHAHSVRRAARRAPPRPRGQRALAIGVPGPVFDLSRVARLEGVVSLSLT